MKRYSWLLLLTLPFLAFAINKADLLSYPDYFPTPTYDLKKNPLSTDKIELGRALFYDPLLSKDGMVSCASCHSPFNAFAHTDHSLSHGVNDSIGTRNAPALMNLAWHKSFMWDGAINHLDVQALGPITHQAEMAETLENVLVKLQNSIYPELFYKAFGDSVITGEHLLKAISQFQLTLVSDKSKYDLVRQEKANFTAQEEKGYNLFKINCASCHSEPLFSNFGFANNGLPIDTTLNDFGKWSITKQPEDSLKFKIPTLRNLSYTYPYMHDGRFTSIRQVLDHYSDGITHGPTLAKELSSSIKLTANEKVDLISFLLTLNDSTFVFNPKYQYPKEILMPSARN